MMKVIKKEAIVIWILSLVGILLISPAVTQAQSYATWYSKAQERIDTLRKGDFGIKIVDKNGQPYTGAYIDYISVSYLSGNLEATDGSKTIAFGPEGISTPITASNDILPFNGSLKVFPNPAEDIIHIEYISEPFQVKIFHSLGVLVYAGKSDTNTLEIAVGQLKRGIYLVKLTDKNNVVNVQKV